MPRRLNYYAANPKAVQAMLGMEKAVRQSGLEPSLLELVKTRASQVNHCAYCIEMHTREARAAGETEERLYMLAAWEEAECYTPRERAALAWTDSLTRLADTGAPDPAYHVMAEAFTPEEQVALTLAIVTINGWNRFAVGFRAIPGEPPG
ncbi:carboxymuconolactone decarboxylase family protein [Roseomonas eburnea]|uniref:Carboxymuconolactone decarboxylase family protein n=1 Tax=Neoroseomonas eburnea TaxID=1346889 RepID=A0A9X9X9Z1_9PROT|nr:carboxymuconolactone decarboxylase family protein [Neoroseomonas eburnea]MBR0680527.1 carboxymuconolactone decarboxylase family protein [Neoroseomonas eburnea]